MKYLSAKLDIVFKMIFASEHNTDILADFLLSVLDVPTGAIKKITILNPYLEPDEPEEKKSILDLKVELDGNRRCNVEIQVQKMPDMVERLHYYKARMVTEQLAAGGQYKDIVKTSCVAILDYPMYKNDLYCHHHFRYYDNKRGVAFSELDLEEIHILEIPKLEQDISNPTLTNWLRFLNAEKKEEFDMLAQTSEPMKKAVGVLANLSADEKKRMIAEDREKFLRDQYSREQGAKEEGRVEGRVEGIEIGKLQTARNLIDMGYPLADITKATGLDESELNRIMN